MTIQQPNWIFQSQAAMAPIVQRYEMQGNQAVMDASRSISAAAWKKAEFDSRALRYRQMQELAATRIDLQRGMLALRKDEYDLKKYTVHEQKRQQTYGRIIHKDGKWAYQGRKGISKSYDSEEEMKADWALEFPGLRRDEEMHQAKLKDYESRSAGRESLAERRAVMSSVRQAMLKLKEAKNPVDIEKARAQIRSLEAGAAQIPGLLEEIRTATAELNLHRKSVEFDEYKKGAEARERQTGLKLLGMYNDRRAEIIENAGPLAERALAKENKQHDPIQKKDVPIIPEEQYRKLLKELEAFDAKYKPK